MGDHSLNLSNAAELVGKYIKYYVRTSVTITQEEPAKTQVNAFNVMMAASRICAILNACTNLCIYSAMLQKSYFPNNSY